MSAVATAVTLAALTPTAVDARRADARQSRSQCSQSADPGPPAGEPFVRRGPTELISGLYLDGGPAGRFRRCHRGTPSPGTLTVLDSASGREVATRTIAAGHLATIPLAPGTYTITGAFADATRDGKPITTLPKEVRIPADRSVREDVVANIP
jgi:hypothetical protein